MTTVVNPSSGGGANQPPRALRAAQSYTIKEDCQIATGVPVYYELGASMVREMGAAHVVFAP